MDKKIHEFNFNEPESLRLDVYLAQKIDELSRSFIKTLINQEDVSVNGRIVGKAGLKLAVGDKISVKVPPPVASDLIPENIPLDIIFEDENTIVINKPAGMVVHPSIGHSSGTLVHAILFHYPDIEGIGGVQRPGVVHRLDKDTSGAIIFAKNDLSHQHLQKQFKNREVGKTYIALVEGKLPTKEGKIDAAIGRDPRARQRMAVMPPNKGRMANSEYSTIQEFKHHSLAKVNIFTGRTHQIRVHMAFIGNPIVGDKVYGFRNITTTLDRQFLHANILTITLLGHDEPTTFTAPLAPELTGLLETLQ
jgi:23S rRNA pseudouridine1911/1915/1917 synthase